MTRSIERRLFFALWPDPGMVAQLAALATGGGAVADYHLTLAFAGPVDAMAQAALQDGASHVRGPGFALTLDSVCRWTPGELRVVVASARPAALLTLATALQRVVRSATGRCELRPYRPHVTLARHDRGAMPKAIAPVSWEVRRFVLAGTRVGGPLRYTIIEEWPLDAEAF
ncbi:MAG: RNA 2',3'-cyclic phosphodiesterase [Acidiferrobacter sp.]